MATLTSGIGAGDTLVAITSGGSPILGDRFELDDELVEFRRFWIEGDGSRWIITRGIEGTRPVAHSQGATLTPWVITSIEGGGGGGPLSIIHEQVDEEDAYGFLDENEQPRYFDGEVMTPD